ncbi:MAG: ribonuclease P protein subunit [Candidatus Thermoplasmatota archaeon]|jgi:RNase P/RNase MRP subunit p29|nr:ribonuclease P protein subunit [Candidatus Thermoplasmatota archaeon]
MFELVSAEYLGKRIEVVESSMTGLKGIYGTVTGESKNMFRIRTDKGEINVPKKVCLFSIKMDSGYFRIHGKFICLRPENRLKDAERILKNMKKVN